MGSNTSKSGQAYELCHTLQGHSQPLNALRFSPDGQFLASAACDAHILIWSTHKGVLLQTISHRESGSITNVIWATNRHNDLSLIFSSADGSIYIYVRPSNKPLGLWIGERQFLAHAGAVEDIAFDQVNRRLATVGMGEVRVWGIRSDWTAFPQASECSRGFIARSVHFFDQGQSLMVSYLESHQIWAWTLEPWGVLWKRLVFSRIGNTALSSSGTRLLVDNLSSGSDSYKFPGLRRLNAFPIPTTVTTPKQVTFDESGNLIIQGSDHGLVYISALNTAKLVQTLQHSTAHDCLVQAITARSHRGQHWIATGSSTGRPTIKVWQRKAVSNERAGVSQIIVTIIFIAAIGYATRSTGLWKTAEGILKQAGDAVADYSWYPSVPEMFNPSSTPDLIQSDGAPPLDSSRSVTSLTTILLTERHPDGGQRSRRATRAADEPIGTSLQSFLSRS